MTKPDPLAVEITLDVLDWLAEEKQGDATDLACIALVKHELRVVLAA